MFVPRLRHTLQYTCSKTAVIGSSWGLSLHVRGQKADTHEYYLGFDRRRPFHNQSLSALIIASSATLLEI